MDPVLGGLVLGLKPTIKSTNDTILMGDLCQDVGDFVKNTTTELMPDLNIDISTTVTLNIDENRVAMLFYKSVVDVIGPAGMYMTILRYKDNNIIRSKTPLLVKAGIRIEPWDACLTKLSVGRVLITLSNDGGPVILNIVNTSDLEMTLENANFTTASANGRNAKTTLLDTNKILLVFFDKVAVASKAVVITLSGSTINVNGTMYTFYSTGTTLYALSIDRLDTSKALVMFTPNPDGYPRACVLGVSGTVVTVGTPIVVESGGSGTQYGFAIGVSSTKGLIIYSNTATMDTWMYTVSITGTTVALQSRCNVVSSTVYVVVPIRRRTDRVTILVFHSNNTIYIIDFDVSSSTIPVHIASIPRGLTGKNINSVWLAMFSETRLLESAFETGIKSYRHSLVDFTVSPPFYNDKIRPNTLAVSSSRICVDGRKVAVTNL